MGAPHERAFCVAVPLYKFIVVFYLSRSSLFPFVKSIPLLLEVNALFVLCSLM